MTEKKHPLEKLVTSKTHISQYSDTPTKFIAPTEAELKARNKRNYALAIVLLGFMVFIFVTMITRAG